MAQDAFVFPDPFTEEPIGGDENPASQMTQGGDQPHIPAVNSTTFTQSPVPRAVIPYKRLIANLDQGLVDMVERAPEEHLAIIPFGAGSKLYKNQPMLSAHIALFLEALAIGANEIEVSKAVWRNKPSNKKDYETPWTLILAGASQELKDFLVWQQTFAVSKELTFTVVPFDMNLRSWVITNISGGAVKEGEGPKRIALGTLKKALWENQRFRVIANKILADQGVPGSARQRAHRATTTFDLTYIASQDVNGNSAPVWQLTGKPLTTDDELHAVFKLEVCRTRVMVGLHYLDMEKRLVECAWCKADSHPAHACPLPKVDDWMGPCPDNAERFRKRLEAGRGRGFNTATGIEPRVPGERSPPPVGDPLDERYEGNGDGQAIDGQREMGTGRTSPSLPVDDRWPIALGAVRDLETPRPNRVAWGAQSVRISRGDHRGRDPPEQSANRPQSAETQQSVGHGTPRSEDPPPEPNMPPGRESTRTTGVRNARGSRCKLNTKAAIKIASLNIRGYTNASERQSKWYHVNQLMREKKIGILAMQETHLSMPRKEEVERLFSKRLKIFASEDPSNPSGKGGGNTAGNKLAQTGEDLNSGCLRTERDPLRRGGQYEVLDYSAGISGKPIEAGNTLLLATDGSCTNNGDDDAKAGAGVFYETNSRLNMSVRVPSHLTQSNQSGELLALKEAVEAAPAESNLKIDLDSKYVIERVTKHLDKDEDSGYIGTQNADLIRMTVARLRSRKTKTEVRWVKGHAGATRNEGADKLAGEATSKPTPTNLDLTISPSLSLTGAKLSKLTQSLAYRAIRSLKMKKAPPIRARTSTNLESIKNCAEEQFGRRPTEERIWKSIRCKDFSKKENYFLWMTIHDAYMVGTHWLRPSYNEEKQERARCRHCGTLETMNHILTECETPGQKEIWEDAGRLWEKKPGSTWHKPILGTILAAPLASFKDSKRKKLPNRARLYRIIMVEAAYLIWKLRCERVIQNENTPFTVQEVQNRWVETLNRRLALDQAMTNKNFSKKAISKDTVLKTWSDIIKNRSTLPVDWTGTHGVLVGSGPARMTEGIG
ncbi:hypothetical protein C0992_005383, partial [Termitomyces sp. T32_za158]